MVLIHYTYGPHIKMHATKTQPEALSTRQRRRWFPSVAVSLRNSKLLWLKISLCFHNLGLVQRRPATILGRSKRRRGVQFMSETIGSKPKNSAKKAAKSVGSGLASSTKKRTAASSKGNATAKKSTSVKAVASKAVASRAASPKATTSKAASPQQSRPAAAASRPTIGAARQHVGRHSVEKWCKGHCSLVVGRLRHLWGAALSFIRAQLPK